jgi:hypothetical protein
MQNASLVLELLLDWLFICVRLLKLSVQILVGLLEALQAAIELAIWVKEICPSCQVLLFSGQSATADLLQDARMTGREFQLLQKPIHPTNLLAAVRATQVGSIMAIE